MPKTRLLMVNGTTDQWGLLPVNISNNDFQNGKCFTLSNAGASGSCPWNIYVDGVGENIVFLRFRNVADHSAIANTAISDITVFLIGE